MRENRRKIEGEARALPYSILIKPFIRTFIDHINVKKLFSATFRDMNGKRWDCEKEIEGPNSILNISIIKTDNMLRYVKI